MSVTNYPIKKLLAQHFQGPVSDDDYGYRTVPTLLRAIANWVDENDLYRHVSTESFRMACI